MDGCGENPLPPMRLEIWTDQPVTSRYTDYAVPALSLLWYRVCILTYRMNFLSHV